MVESNLRIQQFLAESKFVEAQKEAELNLNQSRGSETVELLELYFDSLKAQSRPLPEKYVLTLIDKLLPAKPDEAQHWLKEISKPTAENKQQLLLLEIRIAELKGQTDFLYRFISQYQIARYEFRNPQLPEFVQALTQKYFPTDYQLRLQRLALELLRLDLQTCETLILELIFSCFEKSSPRGTREKLGLLYEVLASAEKLYHLELYKNFCDLMSTGIKEKKDYKKIVELIIYTEDFKFQALLMNLLLKEGLSELVFDYAVEIRKNKKYSYVYFDKFLPQLKSYFFQKVAKPAVEEKALPEVDLKLSKINKEELAEEATLESSEEEILLSHMLKHQSFTTNEFLDVSVSLFQSEFYFAALKAAQLALDSTSDNLLRLKASYLKITCLLKIGDYRSALDHSLDALSLSQTQNDVLSFMYSQAEAHLRLKEYSSAKAVLRKILSIDSNYRLAKERLDRLNAI